MKVSKVSALFLSLLLEGTSSFQNVGFYKPLKPTFGTRLYSSSTEPTPSSAATEYRKEFLDPEYWHPTSPKFEIIDWDKFLAQKPEVPKVFDPPQKNLGSMFVKGAKKFMWWSRSRIDAPAPEETPKPLTGKVSDPDLGLFKALLAKHPDSSKIPEPFRNKLLWMHYNDCPEQLVSFQRGAWRSNTKEGRAVGLINQSHDWTNDPCYVGTRIAQMTTNGYLNFQISPCGKWIKIFVIGSDPSNGDWITMYVVQEDDVFTDKDGNVLDFIKPGDIYRTTFAGRDDPYECDHSKLIFAYIIRHVAKIDEETGEVTVNPDHYPAILEAATAEPPKEVFDATDGMTDDTNLSLAERWDIQVNYISDTQMYYTPATPPFGDVIENL